MNFPQLPEILNIHNAENIYTLDNLHIDRINNIIDTYSTFISRLEMFEEIQAPVLKFLKRSLSTTPERMALYPESKEEALKILKYTISSDLQIHLKMKALDLNFLYLVNTFLDNAEEQIIDSIFMPPINDIEQTDIELAMQATMPQYSPLQNRIAERDLNFLFDFKNIMQTKTQMGIFRIDQKRMNEIIVNNDERPALEEKLVFINDYLLQAVLQNITIKSLIIRDDFVVIRQLKSIFVDSELYEGINKNLETLKQEESYEDTISVQRFRNSLLNKIASHREAITMIINDEQIVDRIQQKDSKLIRELLVFFPDSQEQIQEIVFQNQVNTKKIFDGETDFIKNLVEILPVSKDRVQEIVFQNQATIKRILNIEEGFVKEIIQILPASRARVQEIVFQNQTTIRKIVDLDIAVIKKILKCLPDSEKQLEEIIFENPNIENKFALEHFKVIKEVIGLLPDSKQNIMNILIRNPDNNIKMLELDLNFKNQLLNMDITSREILITFLSNQEIANRLSNLDYNFIERFVDFFPKAKHEILNNILQNPEMRNAIEQLDFYSLRQFPKLFLNSFKNPLLDRLLESQIIKFSLANLNERNIDILTHFKDNLYELLELTKKDKESIPERFLEEIFNSDNNFHEQLLQLNINSIDKLRSLIYLDDKDLLLEDLKIMFFENKDFYQRLNGPYLNIIQRLFVNRLNPYGNNQKYYLGLDMANALTDSMFENKESYSSLILTSISKGDVNLIYSLHHFFESMLDYAAIFSMSGKYYDFQHQCIKQFCDSEVFLNRMSKEPNFILQLNFILNRDNNHFSSVNTLLNYRCSMQNIIIHKINHTNEKIQNFLNKTFLDNLEMFIIMITRNSKNSIDPFKASFLQFISYDLLKKIQSSPLTEENIEVINNLKSFYTEMEDEGDTNLSQCFNRHIFFKLSKENQQLIKDNLISQQQYNVSKAKKNFTVLYSEHLFNIGKLEQNILCSQKSIENHDDTKMTEALQQDFEKEQAILKRDKLRLLSMRIVPADKQIKATNNFEEHGILKVQAIFQAYQTIQDEELILKKLQNKTPEELEVILQQKKQEEALQQQKALIEQQQKAIVEQQKQQALIEQQQKALIEQQQKAIVEQQQKAIVEQQVLAQKASVKQVVVQRRGQIPVVQKPIVQQTTQQAPVQQPTVKRVIAQDARLLVILLEKQQVQQKLAQQKRDLEAAIQQTKKEFLDQQKQREQILAQKTEQEKIQYITAHSKSPKFFIEAQNSLLSTKNKFEQFKKDLELRQMKMPGKK